MHAYMHARMGGMYVLYVLYVMYVIYIYIYMYVMQCNAM